VLGVKLQFPEPSASAVPASVPSKETVTVLWASAIPEMRGVEVFTTAPLAGVSTTGAEGATVSTVKERELEAGPVLPTASVALAVTAWVPCESAVLGVKLQWPEPSASAVPAKIPSKATVTVLWASAVPEITGAEVFTTTPLAGVTTTGAAGATVSTVKEWGPEAELVLPAASVTWAVTE
jgi:hypothetical protein